MFIRQALIEIKFSQSDKIAGVVTLTAYIEPKKLAILTGILPIVPISFMFIGIIMHQFSLSNNIKYLIPIIYSSIVSFIAMRRNAITISRHLFSFLIDSPLYILFLTALI